jgi:hypothetical protein
LKDFACTYADAINGMTADCFTIMFSYINFFGDYPPSLLANMCNEGKLTLNCTNIKEATEKAQKSNGMNIAATQSTLLMITAGLSVLLLIHSF